MPRKRSTRAEIVERENRQAEIIAELIEMGADGVAARLTRCWSERLFGDPNRRMYRCRSISCLTCARPSLDAWWRAFRRWAEEGGASSYLRVPIDDPLSVVAGVAKSLRNLRDRLARESWSYGDVGFLGLSDGRGVHVVVSHPGLRRTQVGDRLRALWPTLSMEDVPDDLEIDLSPKMLALIGARKGALQGLRFAISPRGC